MQISLRDIAETTLEGFSGLVEIDHAADSPRVEDSAKSLASTAITAQFDQMTAGVTASHESVLSALETAPASAEVVFDDPNLVHDVYSNAPQQEVPRTVTVAAAAPETPKKVVQTAEYRRSDEVFAYAERVGSNIGRAYQAKLSGGAHHQQTMGHDLKVREAQIGGTLFGDTPKGDTRTFFNLDTYTWVWNEVVRDPKAKTYRATNVEYDFQPQGVLKVVNGEAKGYVEGKELTNLLTVMKTYHDRVMNEVYGYEQAA